MKKRTGELALCFLMPSACLQSLAMLKYKFSASRAVPVCVCLRVQGDGAGPGSAQVTASKNLIGWRSPGESAAWKAINRLCWSFLRQPGEPSLGPPCSSVCRCPVVLGMSSHAVFWQVLVGTPQSPSLGGRRRRAAPVGAPWRGGPVGWVSPQDWLGLRLCPRCDVCGLFPSLTSVFCPLSADLSAAKRKFADSLNEFKFRCIGDAETDDEICIGESWALSLGSPGATLQSPELSGTWGETCTRMPRGLGAWVLSCSLEMANFSWFNVIKDFPNKLMLASWPKSGSARWERKKVACT